jgi:hypothetical protein
MTAMRRGSSTIVCLVGEVEEEAIRVVARSPNVAVVRGSGEAGPEAAERALREAGGRASPFVLVAADPLGEVAARWRAMWDLRGGWSGFEEAAGQALAAWRAGRFELPDYYVVVAGEVPAEGAPHPQDLHLGVLRSTRPSRVVAVAGGQAAETGARVVRALRGLGQGPWWPPLDRLIEAARTFHAGGLAGEGAPRAVDLEAASR